MPGNIVWLLIFTVFVGKAIKVTGRIWITGQKQTYPQAKSLCESQPNSELVELHQADVIQEFKDFSKYCARLRAPCIFFIIELLGVNC